MTTSRLRLSGALVCLLALFPAWQVRAEPPARITPPQSDLVTTGRPYALTVEMDPAVDATKARITVDFSRTEKGLTAEPVFSESLDVQLRRPLPPVKPAPRPASTAAEQVAAAAAQAPKAPAAPAVDVLRKFQVVINVGNLAEGQYDGNIVVEVDKIRATQPISFFRLPRDRPAEFPFGIYAVPFPHKSEEMQAMLEDIRSTGINLLCLHMSALDDYHIAIFDKAARLGMQFMPSVNTVTAPPGSGEELLDRLSDGQTDPKQKRYCLNNPIVRKAAGDLLADYIRQYKSHPAFSGKVYYGDDLTLYTQYKDGKTLMSCYCDYCRSQFKKLAGVEPPLEPRAKGPVISDDDPWLRWMRYRCGDIFGGFIAEMLKAKNRVDANVKIALVHGWSEQPFTRVDAGVYPPLSQTADVVSSYSYPVLRLPRKDLMIDYQLARMGNRTKDVYMLSLLGMNSTVASPVQVCQNYWNQLAGGYKFISFFSWGDLVKARALGEGERVKAAVAALARCGQNADWVLPIAQNWREPEFNRPVCNAVLYSFATESMDSLKERGGGEHLKQVMACLREADAQHVPMKAVAEDEFLEPNSAVVKTLGSLAIVGVNAIPENVRNAIENFAAGGGRVCIDLKSRVRIKGAKEMSMESMVAMAGQYTACPVSTPCRDISAREFRCSDSWQRSCYYVLVNNFADRYCGMPFDYKDPNANYEQDKLVRDEPVEAMVQFLPSGRYLYDVCTGQPLGTSDQPVKIRLEPSWGMVVCASTAAAVNLRFTGGPMANMGAYVRYEIQMQDDSNRAADGHYAVKVDVTTPSGRTSRYSRCVGLVRGAGEFFLPLGLNDEAGKWTVTAEGGYPRKKVSLTLDVAAGEPLEKSAGPQARKNVQLRLDVAGTRKLSNFLTTRPAVVQAP